MSSTDLKGGLGSVSRRPAYSKGRLPPATQKNAIPPKVGVGVGPTQTQNNAASSAAGIASPLTEVEGSRTYHQATTVYSTSGLRAFRFATVKSITFTDANGNLVVMKYGDTQ